MSEELKPCPLCKNAAMVAIDRTGIPKTGCSFCNIWVTGHCASEQMQAETWNTRPKEEHLTKLVKDYIDVHMDLRSKVFSLLSENDDLKVELKELKDNHGA